MQTRKVLMLGMSQNIGGVETYIMNLIQKMNPDKYCFYFPCQNGKLAYEEKIIALGGKILSTPTPHRNFLKYRAMWMEIFAQNRFDIVYYNTCDIVCIDLLELAKKVGIPIRIIHSHNSGNQQSIYRKMNLLHRISEYRCRKILHHYVTHLFACSKAAGDWMFDGRPYQIIKNGIQLSKYQYSDDARIKLRRDHELGDGIVVGIVGRLDPQKNPMYSIEVLKSLFIKNCKARAVFVGDGELRESVERKADDCGILDRIIFIGAVDNVHEWMSAIDCLLMPSLFEGLPFVLVEAQAAGLPCVVSAAVSEEANITGLVRYVSLDQTPDHWADVILEMCEKRDVDTSEIMTAAGYSIEMTARKVEDIICASLE